MGFWMRWPVCTNTRARLNKESLSSTSFSLLSAWGQRGLSCPRNWIGAWVTIPAFMSPHVADLCDWKSYYRLVYFVVEKSVNLLKWCSKYEGRVLCGCDGLTQKTLCRWHSSRCHFCDRPIYADSYLLQVWVVLMKLNIAGLSAPDVLHMFEAERALVEPGRELAKDYYWWTTRLVSARCSYFLLAPFETI